MWDSVLNDGRRCRLEPRTVSAGSRAQARRVFQTPVIHGDCAGPRSPGSGPCDVGEARPAGHPHTPLQQWVAPLLKPTHAARARARTSREPIKIVVYTSLRGVHLYTTLSMGLPCALRACTNTDAQTYRALKSLVSTTFSKIFSRVT
jgi:hypothetical protein